MGYRWRAGLMALSAGRRTLPPRPDSRGPPKPAPFGERWSARARPLRRFGNPGRCFRSSPSRRFADQSPSVRPSPSRRFVDPGVVTSGRRHHVGFVDPAVPPGCGHQLRAPIAPTARHRARGSARTDTPSMPPSAATAIGAPRARPDQRPGPSDAAPGWLAVAKTGARNASLAPARAARRKSVKSCAELVTNPLQRSGPGQRPPRK